MQFKLQGSCNFHLQISLLVLYSIKKDSWHFNERAVRLQMALVRLLLKHCSHHRHLGSDHHHYTVILRVVQLLANVRTRNR